MKIKLHRHTHTFSIRHTRDGGYPLPRRDKLQKTIMYVIIYNMKSGGYAYILTNKPMGTLYVGSTTDLVGRIWQHKNKTIPGFTSKYNIDKLVYYEWHDSLHEMVLRERQLKKWYRKWKFRLIIQQNPEWKDLYSDVLIANGYSVE